VPTPRDRTLAFNYAAKMNRLWHAAETEHVVMMNDDVVVGSPDWLQALMTFSMQEEVGGVGARLLYPDGTIQHAGMAGGLFGLCAHAWLGLPADAPTYQDWACVHRQWSMVTGAVFATRKSVLEMVDGFDERFGLELNDADLCLRLRMQGLRIVYTPFAEFTHFEKASRGQEPVHGSDLARFLTRWGEYLDQDPAFHPGLDHQCFDIRPTEPTDPWWQDER
jgi:GT2 family glycosyltransferase